MFVRELHATSKPIGRASGRNAVAAAAYRSGGRLHDEREGLTFDYTRKGGVVHSELIVPDQAREWATTRERVWNEAEQANTRKNAVVAREVEVGLPHELDADERRELALEMGRYLSDRWNVVADVNIHEPSREGDGRNHHAHIQTTTREATVEGLGQRTGLELSNRERQNQGLAKRDDELREIREAIATMQNRKLREAGHEVHVEHRSFEERAVRLEPEQHVGPSGTGAHRNGIESARQNANEERRERNAQAIERDPSRLFDRITEKRATFTRDELEREAQRHIKDPERRRAVMEKAEGHAELVTLSVQQRDERTGEEIAPARYTTKEMAKVEAQMVERARDMSENQGHNVRSKNVERALAAHPMLSDEQRDAVRHVTDEGDHKIVVGVAGAGKSRAMDTAREAFEAEGYRVRGAALSGIAAENLEDGSGIESRTLAAYEHAWKNGREELDRNDVLVIDEAGMVGSRQYERFLAHAQERGAKVVAIGDPEQLQSIDAGAAFRVTAERTGYVEITEVRRQSEAWARDATSDFRNGETRRGVDAYHQRGHVHHKRTNEGAKDQLIDDWSDRRRAHPNEERLILAARRVDVRDLNDRARSAMRRDGQLGPDHGVRTVIDRRTQGVEVAERRFAVGDQVMFYQNDRRIGVKNGTVGTVREFDGERMKVGLADGRERAFSFSHYRAVDHGYAATVHKAQGSTTDRTFLYVDRNHDSHMAYVAMTRHRTEANAYTSHESFRTVDDMAASMARRRAQDSTLDYLSQTAERPSERDPVRELGLLRDQQGQLRSRVAAGDPEATQRMRAVTDAMRERAATIHASPELRQRAKEAGLERMVEQHRPHDRTQQRTQSRGADRGQGIGD